MSQTTLRRPVAVLATTIAAGALVAATLPGTPAAAIDTGRGDAGHCTDDTGVTVVVDFGKLGGTPIVRCNSQGTRGTGLDALKGAGFQVSGVQRWGESFICRIENRPSATEKLPLQGDEGYRETCIDTPPATGYWSYWHAGNNCAWEYSQWGVKNRDFVSGGYEGWSFSLNASSDDNPQPRVAPVRPGTTGRGCGTASAPGPVTHDRTETQSGPGVPGQQSASPEQAQKSEQANSADGKLPAAKPRPSTTATGEPSPEPADNVEFTGGENLPDVADSVREESGSSPAAPWVAGGLLVALLAGAAVVSRRRRLARAR